MLELSARSVVERLETLGLVPWAQPIGLSPDEVRRLVGSASHTGLVALLGAAIDLGLVVCEARAHAGAARDVEETVRTVWADRLATVVAHDALLVAAITHLERNGIPARVLKGAALAHLDEIDPSWRTYGDADVLVPDDRLSEAMEVLGELGMSPLLPPVRRWWADRYAKGITLQTADGRHLDLHRTLAAGPLGDRVHSSWLFADGTPVEVGGHTLTALSDTNRFAHACYHAALSATCSHRHRRDVALLARTVRPDDLVGVASAGWSTTVIAAALEIAAAAGGVPSDWLEWIADQERSRDDEVLLVAARTSFATAARVSIGHRGPIDVARYVAGLAWPQRAHLEARGLTRRGHLRSMIVGRR